jgi:hypothetical protein
VSVL